jgi:amino acid transporter
MPDTVAVLGNPAKKKIVAIAMMTLAIMNLATVLSLRAMPSQAEYGMASNFYYVLGTSFLLITTALVAAKSATSYPGEGGIFRWVSEAFMPQHPYFGSQRVIVENTVALADISL